MREFFINGNPPDLTMARRQNQVNPGCVEFDEANHACLNHMCQNGKCVPSRDGQSYECKCKVGYSGPFCDQGELQVHSFADLCLTFIFTDQLQHARKR